MNICVNKKGRIPFGYIIIFFVFNLNLFSQTCPSINQSEWATHTNWYFGQAQIMNFNSGGTGAPSASTKIGPGSPFPAYESCASASDEGGNLVIYTNGVKLWNGNGEEVHVGPGTEASKRLKTGAENPTGNTGSAVQGVMITKHPLNDNDYYIFTTDDAIGGINGITYGFNYSIYSKADDTCSAPQRIGAFRATEQVSATFHKNGLDIWIVTHEAIINAPTKNYHSYLLKCSGLNTTPIISSVGFNVLSRTEYIDWKGDLVNASEFSNERGSIEFQQNPTLLTTIKAAATFHCGQGTWDPVKSVSLLDFNTETGEFSNNQGLGDNTVSQSNPYDCEFSLNGESLYVSFMADPWSGPLLGRMGVYDVATGTYTEVGNTGSDDITIGSLKLGGDGTLYAAQFDSRNWIYQDDVITSDGTSINTSGLGAGSGSVGYGLPNMFIPPQDSIKIQSPGTLTDCDLPLDLETNWLCKGTTAENTSGYENAYSVATSGANACSGCSIDPITGVFNAPGPGTYKVYFEMCSIKDSITFTVGVCGCDADVSNSQPICVGETFLLDTAVISSSGVGVWTIDSIPSTPGITATINNSGSDTLFDASPLNTKYGTYKLKYKLGDNTPPNCLEFDGNNDYVNMGDVNDLGTSDFTIEGWFYLDDTTTALGYVIVNKGLTSVGVPSNAGYHLRTSRDSGDELVFAIGNSDGNVTKIYFNGVSPNRWHHAVGVREGTQMYLYLDGVLVAQGSTPTVYNVNTNIPFCIGAMNKGGLSTNNYFLNGKIDEVRIWDAAKSSVEINRSKDCAVISQEPNLVASYNLDETSGTVANDASSNANHGNLIDGPVWVSSDVAQTCNACQDSMYIDVRKTPTVVIDSIGPFCDDSVAVVMTAIPANGGDVTGGWQIDDGTPFVVPNFDPVDLGAGTYKVKYGVDSLGCVNADSIDVLVKERPIFSIDSIGPFCPDDSPVTLTIQPSAADSGVWSGAVSGISNFDPALLTPGDTTVMYTIAGQCGAADTINVVIDSLRDATINELRDTLVYCIMDPDPELKVNEFGGSWNNSAVVVNTPGLDYKIDLGILGSSTDTMLIYSWADPCGDSDTIWVTTTSQLSAAISQPRSFCDTDSAINLIDSVANLGGTFSGVGITNDTLGTFDPSVSGSGTHVIEYEIPGNCGDLKSVNIVVKATPNPEITNTDTVFCQNDSIIQLTTAQSGGSWSELNDTYGALDTLKSEFKIDSSGIFKLQYGFAGQCSAYDTISIEIKEMPTISFAVMDTLCDDTSIVTISDTVAPISSVLTWSGDGDGSGNFNPNNNIGDNNIVLTANNQGCIYFDSLKIHVLKRANANIVPVPDFCANDTVSYSLSSVVLGQNGVWIGSGITDSIFKVNSAGAGNHLIRHEITGLCGDWDTLTIKVKSAVIPVIDSIGPLCKGSDPFNLVATPVGGVWEDFGGGNTYISSSGSFNPVDSGHYQFVYSITTPCQASDTVSVIIEDVPTTNFSVTPREGCAPLEVIITDESSDIPDESFWDFGNSDTSTDASGTLTHLYSTYGCFDVTLTNSYTNGCSSQTTFSNAVCTYPIPKADFIWSPEVLDIDNNQALFEDISAGNIAGWNWDFSGVLDSAQYTPTTSAQILAPYDQNSENPMVVFDSPSGDIIHVKLKVTNINGCSDSIIKPVTILDKFSVYLPNAFSPNGDFINDEFFPVGRNLEFGDNYDFRIYNRWGTLIWKSKTPYQGWDGRVTESSPSSGEIAQIDVYVWRLIVVDPFIGEEYELVGTVTLMK